ncbi:hypothetical protein TWF788_010920 [Orbilia oligospora]|uniref:Uncharacterized protein n=1 Tax=Orbilia oligospora TaxID=2813651 RepID=A0A7C8KD03_ORBOL|nr:hypothetical protein TWF788_010920 [Orbilia oligospora]
MAKKSTTKKKEPLAQKSTSGAEAKTRGQKRKAEEMGGPALAPVADQDGGDAEGLGVGGAPEAPAPAPFGRTAAKAGQRKGTSAQSRAKRPTRSAEGPPAKKKRTLHKLLRPKIDDKIGFPWWREETEPETEEEVGEMEGEVGEEERGRKRKAEDEDEGEFGRWVKRSRADSLEVLVELGDEEQEKEEGQGVASSRKQRTPPTFQRYEYSDEVKRAPLPMADPLSDSRFQGSHNKSRASEAKTHESESQAEDKNLGEYLKLWDDLGKVAHDDDKCFEVLGADVPTSQLGRKSLLRKKRRLFRELEEIATRGKVYKEEQRRVRLEEGDEERLEVTYASHLRRAGQSPLRLRGRTIERQHWRKA